MNAFLVTLRSLGAGRLAVIAATVLATIGFVTYVGGRIMQPPMALLFGGLDTKEASEMVTKLDGMRVPYELRGNGSQVLVPEDQVLKLRLALAKDGLPTGGTIGYEIFDKTDSLGTTSFVQNINQLRALEGELARTIRSLDGVSGARVHLVLPKREVFARENREPSASVVLKLKGANRLDKGQVVAIQNLVAAAVPDLKAARIAIVDERGTLLTRAIDPGSPAAGTTGTLVEAKAEIEDRLKRSIEAMLERSLGPAKARAEVNADIDFDRVVTNQESFDPDQQVVRSTQTVTEQASSNEGSSQAVSVQSNLPEARGQAAPGNQANSSNTRSEETVNYEIGRTTRVQTREAGLVRRISVAVLVDGNYSQGQDGTRTYQPRPQEELDRLATLVRAAVGFDEKRGDKVEIVNLQFATAEVPDGPGDEFDLLGLTKADLIRMAETGILAIVALLAILLVVRPVITRFLAPLPQAAAADGQPQLPEGQPAPAQITGPAAGNTELDNALTAAGQPSDVDRMIDIARIEGQVKASSVKRVGEIVQRHPDEAVAIVRSWMYQDA